MSTLFKKTRTSPVVEIWLKNSQKIMQKFMHNFRNATAVHTPNLSARSQNQAAFGMLITTVT